MALALLASWAVRLALPPFAVASETVRLYTSFSPDRPGASTTITFGFTISGSNGQVPPPLTSVNLHLPAGIGLARNGLGTAICEPSELYEEGPQGCPANSHIGYGSALAEVPYGPEVVQEPASVYAYRGETAHEHITILFFAEAHHPVYAALVFPGEFVPDTGPFSGNIDTEVPLIPSLPGGSNVSVVQLQSTFGPAHLIYEREVNGELVTYRPRGVTVPRVCPVGGYPFAADQAFEDGSHITARTTAPCPPHTRRRAGSAHPTAR